MDEASQIDSVRCPHKSSPHSCISAQSVFMLQWELICALMFSCELGQLRSCGSGLIAFFFFPVGEMAFPGVCGVVSEDGSLTGRSEQTVPGASGSQRPWGFSI